MNSNPQTICTNIIRHTQNQNIAHFATFPFWPIPTIYAACVNYLRHGNINDSQATSTSRKSTCASEQNEWAWTIFAFIRSDTPISFNVWVGTYEFCLHNMTCLSVTLLQAVHSVQFPFYILLMTWHYTRFTNYRQITHIKIIIYMKLKLLQNKSIYSKTKHMI